MGAPLDLEGNELAVGNTVIFVWPTPIVWKLQVVEHGGIETPQGKTPATVRLIADVTLRQPPGVRFMNLLRTVSPTDQKLVEAVADMFKRA